MLRRTSSLQFAVAGFESGDFCGQGGGRRTAVRCLQEGLLARLHQGVEVFLELPHGGFARCAGSFLCNQPQLAQPDVRGTGGNGIEGFEPGDFLGEGGGRCIAVGRLPQGLLAGLDQGCQILLELPQRGVARGGG